MVTQTIKRWLDRLFAWLPWRKSPEPGYAQSVSNLNTGTVQESMWRTQVDGAAPQPGITFVVVEHGRDETMLETKQPANEDPSERLTQLHPSATDETTRASHISSATNEPSISHEDAPQTSPSPEQRLAFLRYLVQ